jgi:hypothetical protein
MKRLLYILILISIISCSTSDDSEEITPTDDGGDNMSDTELTCTLSKVLRGDSFSLVDSLVYDDSGRLIKEYNKVLSTGEIRFRRYDYLTDAINIYSSAIGINPTEESLPTWCAFATRTSRFNLQTSLTLI